MGARRLTQQQDDRGVAPFTQHDIPGSTGRCGIHDLQSHPHGQKRGKSVSIRELLPFTGADEQWSGRGHQREQAGQMRGCKFGVGLRHPVLINGFRGKDQARSVGFLMNENLAWLVAPYRRLMLA